MACLSINKASNLVQTVLSFDNGYLLNGNPAYNMNEWMNE